jgi:hypothetical protein
MLTCLPHACGRPQAYRDIRSGGVSIRGTGASSKDAAERAKRSSRAVTPIVMEGLTERELAAEANRLLYGERERVKTQERQKRLAAVLNQNKFVWRATVYTVAPPKR